MATLLLLVSCMGLGWLARRVAALPADSHLVINAWVLWISLPAVVLRTVHAVQLSTALVMPVVGLWVCFGLAAAVGVLAVRRGAPRGVVGALVLVAGLSNSSFVGLPLIEALGGTDAVGPAAVVDQLGSFFVLAVGAVPLAAWLAGGRVSLGFVARKALVFPPFLALVVALASRPLAFPPVLDEVLHRLGDMLSPLALASVGWQLDGSALRGQGRRVVLGLAYKLVLAPALMLALVWLVAGRIGLVQQVAVAQAAMAPMVTGGVLAAQYELEPRLGAGLIAVGVPLSLCTVPAWWWLCGHLAG